MRRELEYGTGLRVAPEHWAVCWMWRANTVCVGVGDLLGWAAVVPAGLAALRTHYPFTLPHFL